MMYKLNLREKGCRMIDNEIYLLIVLEIDTRRDYFIVGNMWLNA